MREAAGAGGLIWIFAGIGVIALAIMLTRAKPGTSQVMRFDEQKARLGKLSPDEQQQLARECREIAYEGYDEGASMASAAGKSIEFAHQVGVLEAAQRVLANERRQDDQMTRGLQMETAPFNKLNPELGRNAIAEYLVWKFFPDLADLEPVQQAIRFFVADIYDNSDQVDERFRYEAIYSNQYDWQQLAVLEAKALGEKDD